MSVNNVVLVGRLVRDVKVDTIGENVKQAKFTLAVDRRYKRKGAERPDTDFIKVTVMKSGADFAEKYFSKGKQVSVVGSIETYSFEQHGKTVYDFCVKADQLGFADSISDTANTKPAQQENAVGPDFDAIPTSPFDLSAPKDFSAGEDIPFGTR